MGENGEKRLKELEKLYSQTPGIDKEIFSIETLLDILVVLYDECNTPLLKRDKHVIDFLDIGKFILMDGGMYNVHSIFILSFHFPIHI